MRDSTQEVAAARTRPWLIASGAALGWGLLTIAVLHIVSSRNPALDTLSSYAFTDRGTGLLAASILALAVGSLFVLAALRAAGVPITRTTGILFGTWSGGLTLAAVFPASYAEFPDPVSGEIHQYACLVAFLSLPAIGFALLDSLRETPALAHLRRTLTGWTLLSAGTLALFGVSYLLAGPLPVGVTQRLALLADLALLHSLLVLAGRAATVAREPATP
ncbi:MAG TPA: DUF998 domain-containing protein [Actinophytocola sp.]|uniref:DUF998 domain-containing protein n=1 Tax=Actinophytocola sp. TaxID=1872138 RepID=UPI002DDCA8FA|nr:DUF998 domain-containing protein [Actinophytocola sp.]HEV2780056.1 DUF998 domain-containing protein [Actinophytocola sp.]